MWGNLLAFLERLDDELFKSLQCIDPHTQDYVNRLKDEPVFLVLAHLISDYFEKQGDTVSMSKVSNTKLTVRTKRLSFTHCCPILPCKPDGHCHNSACILFRNCSLTGLEVPGSIL